PALARPEERGQGAAELERRDRADRLVLEPDLGGKRAREELGPDQWSLGEVGVDRGASPIDAGGVGQPERRLPLGPVMLARALADHAFLLASAGAALAEAATGKRRSGAARSM